MLQNGEGVLCLIKPFGVMAFKFLLPREFLICLKDFTGLPGPQGRDIFKVLLLV